MWSKTSIIHCTVSLKNPLFANAETKALTGCAATAQLMGTFRFRSNRFLWFYAQFVPNLIGDPDSGFLATRLIIYE